MPDSRPRITVTTDYVAIDSVRDLAARSTLVVRATVVRAGTSRKVAKEGVDKLPLPQSQKNDLVDVYTDVVLRPVQVLKGSPSSAEVTVSERGGVVDGQTWEVSGESLSQVGTQYLLFMTNMRGFYEFSAGAAQSRYRIESDGTLVLEGESVSPVQAQLTGMRVADLERDYSALTK